MIRILLAVALAATGHVGASVLVAILAASAGLVRAVLPVLPQLSAAGLGAAVIVMAYLVFRSVKGWPHIAVVAQ